MSHHALHRLHPPALTPKATPTQLVPPACQAGGPEQAATPIVLSGPAAFPRPAREGATQQLLALVRALARQAAREGLSEKAG